MSLTGILVAIFILFVVDRFGMWLENKGLIYWRKRQPSSGLLHNGFQELNATFRPSIRHVMEINQKKDTKIKKDNAAGGE